MAEAREVVHTNQLHIIDLQVRLLVSTTSRWRENSQKSRTEVIWSNTILKPCIPYQSKVQSTK